MAIFIGTSANNTLTGGSGDDSFTGNGGNDTITGSGGNDTVYFSGSYADYVITWDSTLRRYTIADTVDGRDGTDIVKGVEYFQFADGMRDWSTLLPHAGDGITATAPADGSPLVGSVGFDKLYGDTGTQLIDGGAGDDFIFGGGGYDVLVGGAGDDTIQGGAQIDTASYSGNLADYSFSYDPTTHRYTVVDSVAGRDGTDTVKGVEQFKFADTMVTWGDLVPGMGDGVLVKGGAGDDTLEGGGGYDTIYGYDGNDWIIGDGGNDKLYGGNGDDQIQGNAGDDYVDGGAGTDVYFVQGDFSEFSITYDAATHAYTLQHVAYEDYIPNGTDVVRNVERFIFADGERSWGELVPHAGDGITVNGTADSETIAGGTGLDRLYGNDGFDNIDGGAADDLISGGTGNDNLVGGGGDDKIDGGADADYVFYSGNFADYAISWSATARQYTIADSVDGRDGTDTVKGVEYFVFADGTRNLSQLGLDQGDGLVLTGNADGNYLMGSAGFDRLTGAGGDDLIVAMDGGDTISGGDGADRIWGGNGNDTIDGGTGEDQANYYGMSTEYVITYDAATRSFTIADTMPGRDGTDVVKNVEQFMFADGLRDFTTLVPEAGLFRTINGTAADDMLWGAGGNDRISGLDGNDHLNGYIGNDVLAGGNGDDTLQGDKGDDSLDGGAGFDTAYFMGYRADYTITWDAATRSYTVVDSVADRDGTDVVKGVENFSFMDGGYDWGNLVSGMGDGITLMGTAADDMLQGSAGYDRLTGGDGNDLLDGRGADDVLAGGNGDDNLMGGMGDDKLDGGAGFDTAFFAGNAADYTITWDAATRSYTVADNYAGRDGTDVVKGVENFHFYDVSLDWGSLVAGAGDGFTLVGTATDDMLQGSVGYDRLTGGDGNDLLDGRGANDVLAGGNGDDNLMGGMGDDKLDGGAGFDTAFFAGMAADYTITWDAATRSYTVVDNYAGRDGTDVVKGVENFHFYDVSLDWGSLVAGAGDGFTLVGTAADDMLQGSAGYDRLTGGDGNDLLDGRGANDVLAGGNGDDNLMGGMGDDRLDGGAGFDTAFFAGNAADYTVTWDATTRSYTVADNYANRDGADVVKGVENFHFYDVTLDWSNLVAGAGDGVTVNGTTGPDYLQGSAGYDKIYGGDGNDMVDGGLANDLLNGGAGDDWLLGSGGNDALDGGTGNDTAYYGGALANYAITYNGTTKTLTLQDMVGSDGTDTVKNVESFNFADGSHSLAELVGIATAPAV